MRIHEFQAKRLLSGFGVAVPKGQIAYSPEQAAYRVVQIGGEKWAVKAQVHAGARGRAGGVVLCEDGQEVWEAAEKLIGKALVTEQTGPAGKMVNRVFIEAVVPTKDELYLAFALDRINEGIVVVASSNGGKDIEDTARENPSSILHRAFDPIASMHAFEAREIAFSLGLPAAVIGPVADTILKCFRAFCELDATLVEINPLTITEDGAVLALDAKMTFDDNALYRNQNIAELRDRSQEDPREREAINRGLSYVGLTGNIGCIINGAGLSMATMDMIKDAGGEPANFLDIGGGASPERVAMALRLVLSDDNVAAILVNIFAGINRCDWVADGIIQAVRKTEVKVPLVVRLSGTHVDLGRQMLEQSGLAIIGATNLREAAERVVAATKAENSTSEARIGARA
jgi:succinyl-CoA synthetase beta subunit/malate-CoA ligase subunit beta